MKYNIFKIGFSNKQRDLICIINEWEFIQKHESSSK